MATVTINELPEIIEQHAMWLAGDGGQRADLRGADLRNANLRMADLSEANLRGAILRGAKLSGADLRGAILIGADLRCAGLSDADLSRADLSGADLRMADLSNASLRDADLTAANLSGANLSAANISGADLRMADLSDANLRGANLSGADLSGATLPCTTQIDGLDAKILAAIDDGGKLDMHVWHTCETTHCRAGWAVVVAGGAGRAMEELLGTNAAAALIYAASYPDEPVPNFYASNDDAMADMRRRAGKGQ